MNPKNLSAVKKNLKIFKSHLNNKQIYKIYNKFENNFNLKKISL